MDAGLDYVRASDGTASERAGGRAAGFDPSCWSGLGWAGFSAKEGEAWRSQDAAASDGSAGRVR